VVEPFPVSLMDQRGMQGDDRLPLAIPLFDCLTLLVAEYLGQLIAVVHQKNVIVGQTLGCYVSRSFSHFDVVAGFSQRAYQPAVTARNFRMSVPAGAREQQHPGTLRARRLIGSHGRRDRGATGHNQCSPEKPAASNSSVSHEQFLLKPVLPCQTPLSGRL